MGQWWGRVDSVRHKVGCAEEYSVTVSLESVSQGMGTDFRETLSKRLGNPPSIMRRRNVLLQRFVVDPPSLFGVLRDGLQPLVLY